MSQRVIVTGGTGSLGRALCSAFAQQGADIGFAATNSDHAAQLVSELTSDTRRVGSVIADFADPEAAGTAVSDLAAQIGGCDVLINNAALGVRRGLADASAADWLSTLSVNVVAPFFAARAASALMKTGGVIINIASEMAMLASATSMLYPTSKAALAHLGKCLAADLAPRGIRVLTIAPGPFRSAMLERSFGDADPATVEDGLAALTQRVPLGRIAEPEEIAAMAVFLASPAASYATGAVIPLDGGTTLPRRPD